MCAAIWEFQSLRQGGLPDDLSHADELGELANGLVERAAVNKKVLEAVPRELLE